MTDRETLDLYEATGALMRGHFRLTSGLHSDVYLQSALVLQHPVHAAALGARWRRRFAASGVQTVLAPAIGGILVAHEVARALGVRALFTEREDGRDAPPPRVHPGARRAVPRGRGRDDHRRLHPRGRRLRRRLGGAVVGVGSLIDRSGGAASFPVKRAALATVKATTWKPEECPLCQAGGQAVKPGSRA